VIIFDSVWFLPKKITKIKFFFKKPKPNRNSVWLFRAKTETQPIGLVFFGLAWFFRFDSVFFGLA
jgi:hypothetical protein